MSHFCVVVATSIDNKDELTEVLAPFDEQGEEYCIEQVHGNGKTYYTNPNGKWDWWIVGGRWEGFFVDVQGVRVDSEWRDNIDFESPVKEVAAMAAKEWDDIHEFMGGRTFESFLSVASRIDINDAEGKYIKKLRDQYHNQPLLQELRNYDKIRNLLEPRQILFKEYDDYLLPRDQFIKQKSQNVITPFALLYQDNWLQQGEMGMFGSVSNEKNVLDWQNQYLKALQDIPGNPYLWTVDCHV